jgi:hypothetical protein
MVWGMERGFCLCSYGEKRMKKKHFMIGKDSKEEHLLKDETMKKKNDRIENYHQLYG